MKVIQVNLDRCKRAMDLLRQKCDSEKIDLAIIAEPNKNMIRYSSRWVADNRLDAAIYIPKSNSNIRKTGKGNGYVWVETDDFVVYSCYISPASNEDEFQQLLRDMDQSIRHNKRSVIIGGDFNAKAYCWGSPIEDKKGSILAEWASGKDYIILNDGKIPTFERNGGSSYIDITMCSAELGRMVSKWYVSDEENLSYHKNIYMELKKTKYKADERSRRRGWIYEKDRKEELLARVEQQVRTPNYAHQPEELGKAIENACDMVFKKKYPYRQRRGTYWWSEEIAIARRTCTQAKRKATRANGKTNVSEEEKQHLRNQYKQSRNTLTKAIIRAKKDAWERLCTEVDEDLWGLGYKIVTEKVGLQSPISISDEEQMKVARKLFPDHRKMTWPRIEVIEDDIPLVTRDEIRKAGEKIKPKKAAGPDGIPPEVIRDIAVHKPELLVEIMNRLIRNGVFPIEWKIGKLILLEKPEKTGAEKAYRPICLLNVMGKLFEHIINRRLIDAVEEKGGFAPRQYGFRKGRSTIDAVRAVKGLVEETNRMPDTYMALVTLDVKNASNSTPWKGIVDELRRRQIAPYLIGVICSYLENREILVGENQTRMTMSCGVPQGSVLGPTLWNLYYDGVFQLKGMEETTIVGYADDIAVVVKGEDRNELEDRIEWAVGRIGSWMTQKGLQLALHKTELVILVGRRTIRDISIKIDNIEIESQKKLKYLGIEIGHNMNMGAHIQSVTKKAERTVVALGRLMPNIGGPKSSKRRLFNSVVNSIILYGAPVWKDIIEKARYRKIVEGAQRKIAIRIASAYRTVATKSVQVIAGIIPIHLMIKERTYDRDANQRAQKLRARENSMQEWQREWDLETATAQCTKKLIPNIKPWFDRKHGEIGYYLTQFLSGHGRFKSYLARLGLAENELCVYCGQIDMAEHTILICGRWEHVRETAFNGIGEITTENIVNHMLENEGKWSIIEKTVRDILKTKEEEERR